MKTNPHKKIHFSLLLLIASVFFSVVSLNLFAETFQLGDVAPRGAPDGQLNAADSLILQQMVLGNILPTTDEQLIGDVAPLGAPDGALNAGDLVVQQRAILGEITLGTVDTSPPSTLPAPTLNAGISPTTDNPYLITGTASPGAAVDIYIAGVARHQTTGDATTGVFSVAVYLFDGVNDIYAVENDGIDISSPSNTLQVQYDNVIDRVQNVPITGVTVWTPGATSEPYIISSSSYVLGDLIIQPGVEVIIGYRQDFAVYGSLTILGTEQNRTVLKFDSNAGLKIYGKLTVVGTEQGRVLLTSNKITKAASDWNGVEIESPSLFTVGDVAKIDYAQIEYADAGVHFGPDTRGRVTNSIIINNKYGIEAHGSGNAAYANARPFPIVTNNSIYNNNTNYYAYNYFYNIYDTLDATNNWWGTSVPSEIASKIRGFKSSPSNSPFIDYTGFLSSEWGDSAVGSYYLGGPISDSQPGGNGLVAGTTYQVLTSIIVPTGKTLTIPEGVTLQFVDNADLMVNGSLIAIGTEASRIILTRQGTNNWDGIDVVGSVFFDYVDVTNAVTGIDFNTGSTGNIRYSRIVDNSSYGIYSSTSYGTTDVNLNPMPVINYSSIYGNNVNYRASGYYVDGENIVLNARNNWWGTTVVADIASKIRDIRTGSLGLPTVDYTNFLSSEWGSVAVGSYYLGGPVSDSRLGGSGLVANVTYQVLSDMTIPEGEVLTIPEGVELQFLESADFVVNGTLIATGSETSRIVFTRQGAIDDWDGIDVYGSVILDYVDVSYAYTGVDFMPGSGGSIRNSRITDAYYAIYASGDGVDVNQNPMPVINNNSIYNNTYNYAVRNYFDNFSSILNAQNNWWGTSVASEIADTIFDYSDVTSVVATVDYTSFLSSEWGNPVEGLYYLGGPTSDSQAGGNAFIAGETYQVLSSMVVPVGETLTIPEGVKLQFSGSGNLIVDGTLVAAGTETSRIKFLWGDPYAYPDRDGIIVNGTVVLDYVEITNAYIGIEFKPGSGGSISNSRITDNDYGIYTSGDGNDVNMSPMPVINYNSIYNNRINYLAERYAGNENVVLNARNNWWGTIVVSDIANTISDVAYNSFATVDYFNFLSSEWGSPAAGSYYPVGVVSDSQPGGHGLVAGVTYQVLGSMVVPVGETLTMPEGVELQFLRSASLIVNGTLVTTGTETSRTVFTSAGVYRWDGIVINGTANIKYAEIKNADKAVDFKPGSGGSVTYSRIINNGYGIYARGNGINSTVNKNPQPDINNNSIYANSTNYYADNYADNKNIILNAKNNWWGTTDLSVINSKIVDIRRNPNSAPLIDYSSFLSGDSGTVVAGINFYVGGTVFDAQAGGNGLVAGEIYILLDGLTVPESETLTVPEGVTLQFPPNTGLIINGTFIAQGSISSPVVFTNQDGAVGSGTSHIRWDGINVSSTATGLNLKYVTIERADAGLYVNGANVLLDNSELNDNKDAVTLIDGSGQITNNIIQNNTRAILLTNSSPLIQDNQIVNNRLVALYLREQSSPVVKNNIISGNRGGISMSGSTTLENYPSPIVNYNEITDNIGNYEVRAGGYYTNGSVPPLNFKNNWWGSVSEMSIDLSIYDWNDNNLNNAIVDFSDFLASAGGGVYRGGDSLVMQTCPTVRVTDDTNYIDTYPNEDIDWIGNNYTDVAEIEKAFNNARSMDDTVIQYLKMPSQVDWDAMSVQQQGLYLINSERQARGIKPYEGVSPNIVAVAKNYADFTRLGNLLPFHFNDGKSPTQRLNEDLAIADNSDGVAGFTGGEMNYSNVPFFVAPSDSESVVTAIYLWTYVDEITLVGKSWGHRDIILFTGYQENSGVNYKEGLLGFGVSAGDYQPISNSGNQGSVTVVNVIDPSATWDFTNVITVNTDNAQQCNNRVTLTIDETAIPVAQIKSLAISSSDIYLTPGITAQLTVTATYLNGTTQDITSAASFVADNLSVVDINAGTITALRSGYVYAIASANGVTSNSVLINVANATDTSNLAGTNAANYAAYIPNNATISQYDPKVLNVFTGIVNDKSGAALADVTISIHNAAEYGSVKTDINGRFAMAAEAGTQTLAYSKIGYLTVHREKVSASNAWAVMDDVIMMNVDSAETPIDLSSTIPQIHTSTPVTDAFGTRATTLVFNGISTATVTSADGTQRALSELIVRATEYELPQSMPAELPKESAFTYCSELEVLGVRDDEVVTFDNDVVMYVDNFLNFNPGEIVPIGYYDRQIGEWVESSNGIVVKLLDTNNDGSVDGLDINSDNIADDLNQNGNTADEVAGIESYTVGKTYWRGSFNHFTPVDYNWPFIPPGDAINRGSFNAETSNEKKEQKELECTGSYVKPETQAFNEDIAITGTNLTLHYSSQRTEGYKHKFNVQVSGDTVPASMIEMLVKLEIGGNVFQQTFTPQANKEAEFIWDGNDPDGNRIKGVVNGLISIGFKYNTEYASAGTAATPQGFATVQTAWAQIGSNSTTVPGRDEFISWSSSPISVQNTFNNQIADGWTLSNHHLSSTIGNIYKGDGEVMDIEKTSLILKTGVKLSQYNFDDGFYQKGGSDIDYEINANGELFDKTTQLKWQYTDTPEKFINKQDAIDYCSAASFAINTESWRLPTNKELNYIIDKSGTPHEFPMYNTDAIFYWNQATFNDIDKKLLPVLCVKGTKLDDRYIADLVRDNAAEVVVDTQNGLMWQDDATTTTVKRDWTGAIDYCEIDMDGFAGYTDWRLPNINELIYALPNTTFVNFTTIPPGPWSPISSFREPYWASTPGTTNTKAWAIESKGLSSNFFAKTDLYNIRCVRDNIQAAKSPYKFDINGRHITTVDETSGITLTRFAYDQNDQLITITDERFGDVLTINRDPGTGKALSITTQDGYVTQLSIDANNDLKQIDYADGTNYQFIYDDVSLLTSKTDPNSNIFLHQFDTEGRTIQTSDSEGGLWNFTSSRQGNSSALYGYTTAELNSYQTLRTILPNGDTNKVTTLTDGTQLTDLNQADDLKQTLQSCGVTTVIDKIIDSKTKEPIPSLITITQPSGLQNITTLTKSYGEGGADTTKQTLNANLNGNTNIVFTDSTSGVTTATSAENRVTTLNYDPATLLLQSSQTTGLLDTSYTYDTRGRQKTITTGTRSTTFTYDPTGKGDITTITADDGKQTQFEYDALGRISAIVYPDGNRTENNYDSNGNLRTITVPTPAVHSKTYNATNKVASETAPKDILITEVTQYNYNTEGSLTQITLPSTKIINNTYIKGLLDTTTTPEGTINYSYTCNEKISNIAEGTESIGYSYDGSLLKDITYAGTLNKVISQTYSNDFNVITQNYAGLTSNFAYDKDSLLTSTNGYTITRNAQNGLPETVANGTLQQTRTFNGYGEADTVNTVVNSKNTYNYTLGYNDLGKIVNKTETLDDGTVNTYVYVYDDRRRLTTVTKNTNLIESYSYDANGNRTLQSNVSRSISNQSASYNLGDQLTSNGSTTYEYDADGYLSKKTTGTNVTTYQYSSQGRLLQVVTPTKTITYQHNAIGNRVAKLVDGVVTEKYLWLDKTTLLATYDKDNILLQRYQYTDSNTPNSFTQGGATYYLVTDHLGSPRAITDSAGTIVKKLDYDAFGNIVSDSNPSFEIPFGFAGGLYDRDTGLVRFGFRDYDSDTGRWTARDPIGFAGGDTNLYGYVFNDPVNFLDQDGLLPSVPQGVVNFLAGLGDGITLGLTDKIRDAIGANGSVNKCSGAFKAGGIASLGLVGGGAGAAIKGGLKALGNSVSKTAVRATRGGDKAVRITRRNGSVIDISPKRVKEFVPNANPNAPSGALNRVKFDNALPGSKGFKRAPTKQDLNILNNVR